MWLFRSFRVSPRIFPGLINRPSFCLEVQDCKFCFGPKYIFFSDSCWSFIGLKAVSGGIIWIQYMRMYANRHIYTGIFAVGVLRIPRIAAGVSAGLPRDLYSRGCFIPNNSLLREEPPNIPSDHT